MKFGNLLRLSRQEAGVKLRPLARELGISHTYLIAIEQNKRPASRRIFEALVDRLKMNRDDAELFFCQLSDEASNRIATEPAFTDLVNYLARRYGPKTVKGLRCQL